MSRKGFSEHTGIPVRTLEDWEAGRRTPPECFPRKAFDKTCIKWKEISLRYFRNKKRNRQVLSDRSPTR